MPLPACSSPGLSFSFLLVTPTWVMVELLLHVLTS